MSSACEDLQECRQNETGVENLANKRADAHATPYLKESLAEWAEWAEWSVRPSRYCTLATSGVSPTMYESTRRPTGSCTPLSSSTRVSRIFLSTCSVGSSVRTFFGPSSSPRRTTCPQNFCLR